MPPSRSIGLSAGLRVPWIGIVVGVALAVAVPFERAPGLVLGAWLLAGGSWAVALARAARSRASVRVVVAGACALRLIAFAGDPALSDDVHRYVWEGELVRRGIDPYALAPNDPRLDDVGRALPATREVVNHPDVPAAYPPVAQFANALGVTLGRAAARLTGSEDVDRWARHGVRALYALCDLLVLVPLAWLVRRAGRSPAHLIAWAWCPLVAIELGGVGHFDALAILFLVSALALASSGRTLRGDGGRNGRDAAVVMAVGGAATKLLPGVLVPFLLRGPGARRRVAWAAGTLAVVTLPLLGLSALGEADLAGPDGGLSTYAFRWESGSLVHRFVEAPFARLFDYDEGPTDPRRLARAVAAIAWVAAVAWLLWRRADVVRAARVATGSFLVLSPTLHPWYVAWIVPFLALRGGRAWTWLVVVVPLAYAPLVGYRDDGRWVEPAWYWPLVAVPFFVALVLDAVGRSPEGFPWRRPRRA